MVKTKNYTSVSDAGLERPENGSQWNAELQPAAANLSDTDHFSYYTVEDRDSRFLLEFNYWIQAFLFKLVPCVLLTVLTVMLIVAMHQANVRRMKLKSQVDTIPCFRGHDKMRSGADLRGRIAIGQF